MNIDELEDIRDIYVGLIPNLLLGKIDKSTKDRVEAAIRTLDSYIDQMPTEKLEDHYVAIYLAYEFYRLKAEYFS